MRQKHPETANAGAVPRKEKHSVPSRRNAPAPEKPASERASNACPAKYESLFRHGACLTRRSKEGARYLSEGAGGMERHQAARAQRTDLLDHFGQESGDSEGPCAKGVCSELIDGMRRPCCWIGCIHRTDKSISPSVQGTLNKR
jgi:hypothetical protein